MKEKQFLFENIAAKILISKAAKNRTLVLEARIESEFYLSLRRGIRSFWKRMVRKGRERESLYYHIHEASISKSMSWSDGASGQRGRSHNQSLEECQCQGLARPRGDNETSSQSRVGPPQCFETILIAPFTILDRRSETKTPVGPRFC